MTLKTLKQLALEKAGEAYALRLQFESGEILSVTATGGLLRAFVDRAQHMLGEGATTGLDLDDGTMDPWTEGP